MDFDYSDFPKSYVLAEYFKFIKKNKKKLKIAQSYEASISDTFFYCYYDGVHDTVEIRYNVNDYNECLVTSGEELWEYQSILDNCCAIVEFVKKVDKEKLEHIKECKEKIEKVKKMN